VVCGVCVCVCVDPIPLPVFHVHSVTDVSTPKDNAFCLVGKYVGKSDLVVVAKWSRILQQ